MQTAHGRPGPGMDDLKDCSGGLTINSYKAKGLAPGSLTALNVEDPNALALEYVRN